MLHIRYIINFPFVYIKIVVIIEYSSGNRITFSNILGLMHCRDFWIKNNTFLFRKMKSKMFSKCQTFCFRLSAKCILFTHWFRITHIWVSKQTTIGSDNGLSPGRSQAIILTNDVILSIGQTFAHPHILSILDLSFYCNESTAVLNNQVTIHRPANKNTKTRLQMEK